MGSCVEAMIHYATERVCNLIDYSTVHIRKYGNKIASTGSLYKVCYIYLGLFLRLAHMIT